MKEMDDTGKVRDDKTKPRLYIQRKRRKIFSLTENVLMLTLKYLRK